MLNRTPLGHFLLISGKHLFSFCHSNGIYKLLTTDGELWKASRITYHWRISWTKARVTHLESTATIAGKALKGFSSNETTQSYRILLLFDNNPCVSSNARNSEWPIRAIMVKLHRPSLSLHQVCLTQLLFPIIMSESEKDGNFIHLPFFVWTLSNKTKLVR